MPETAKTLSVAQVLVLSTAARRPARMALPLPAGLRARGAARRALLASAGRLKPKQIVVAAMRKLLVLCFGVLKTGKRFDPAIAMPA